MLSDSLNRATKESNGDAHKADLSGSSMDRTINRPVWRIWLGLTIGAVLIIAAIVILWQIRSLDPDIRVTALDRTRIATVSQGSFEDFIPIRGEVTPARTVFLDAIEGGRVETVHVEDGTSVKIGDLLAVLSNSQLQLDVLSREAAVEEQLNNLRTLELDIERNRIDHARNIIGIDYQIRRLTRLTKRLEPLVEIEGGSLQAEYQDSSDELDYQQKLRAVTADAQETDARLGGLQIKQLRAASERLNKNLAVARGNLDGLNIRAPVEGTLTAFNAEIGQSLARGERIGQIDSPNNFKIVAGVDEFYADRIQPGLTASVDLADRNYELRIGKVYPQIVAGQFTADLLFVGDAPNDLRRGQTLSLRLSLGGSQSALIVENGPFLQTTGGNWAFLLDESGQAANRVPIRTGRRNSDHIEILDGLSEGDRVVVSTYTPFAEADRVQLEE